jgi:hypothetical protein
VRGEIGQDSPYGVDSAGEVALNLTPPKPKDHIALFAQKPVADNVDRLYFSGLTVQQSDDEPGVMLHEIKNKRAEGCALSEAMTFQRLEPHPQPCLQRIAGR